MTTRFPNGITATITGNVTGNITGNVTGNVTGDLTGNSTGTHTGAVTGTSVTASTDKTDFQATIGVNDVLNYGTGTWTTTRGAQANYFKRHTAGDETSIIAIDITEPVRTTASKGFKLVSIDYVYMIGTAALDAHSCTLDKVNYTNNAAPTVTSTAVTATLATATQAQPYVTNIAVDAAAFNNTADSKYVLEITVNHAATSVYDFYGVTLKFSRNDL